MEWKGRAPPTPASADTFGAEGGPDWTPLVLGTKDPLSTLQPVVQRCYHYYFIFGEMPEELF